MKKFEYFEHTADTLFRAYGKSFEEALSNTILAVYNVIVDTKTIKPVTKKVFSLKSKTKESLIYDMINELLFLQDTESFLGCEIKKLTISESQNDFELVAEILGDTNAEEYDVFGQIKSATYSEMKILEENGNVFIQAVLDL